MAGKISLHEGQDGSSFERSIHKIVSIDVLARHRYKQRPGNRLPGVHRCFCNNLKRGGGSNTSESFEYVGEGQHAAQWNCDAIAHSPSVYEHRPAAGYSV